MPDYDLGRAQGRIVIENDSSGTAAAKRDLQALTAEAENLEQALDEVSVSSGDFQANMEDNLHILHNLRRAAEVTAEAMVALGHASSRAYDGLAAASRKAATATRYASSAVFEFGKVSGSVLSRALGIHKAIDLIGSSASEAVQKMMVLRQTIGGLFSFGGLVQRKIGIDVEIGNLGSTFSSLLQISAVINSATSGVSTLQFMARRAMAANGLLGRSLRIVQAGFLGALTGVSRFYSAIRDSSPVQNLMARFPILARGLNAVEGAARRASVELPNLGRGFLGLFQGVSSLATGVAGLRIAFRGIVPLIHRLIPLYIAFGVALAAVRVAGTGVSNVISSLGTLSRGALLLPSILAGAGIAAGVLRAGLSGLGDAFSAASLDGEEFWEAIKEMSPTMREIAIAAKDVQPSFENLKEMAEGNILEGFADQIRELTDRWMPLLEQTVTVVGTAFRRVKDEAVAGLMDERNLQDFEIVAGATARAIDTLSAAVQPLGRAFANLSVGGSAFFSPMADQILLATNRLELWSEAQRSGTPFLNDMEKGVQGWKNLKDAIADTTAGIGELFGIMGSGSYGNPLQRWADSAAEFRLSMETGDSSTKAIFNALSSVAEKSLSVIKEVTDGIRTFFENTGDAATIFSEGFLEAIKKGLAEFQAIVSAMGSFIGVIPDGIISFIAAIAGLVATTRIVRPAMLAAFRGLAGVIGITNLVSGLQQIRSGMNGVAGSAARMVGLRGSMDAFVSAAAQLPTIGGQMARSFQSGERWFLGMAQSTSRGAIALAAIPPAANNASVAFRGLNQSGSTVMGAMNRIQSALALTVARLGAMTNPTRVAGSAVRGMGIAAGVAAAGIRGLGSALMSIAGHPVILALIAIASAFGALQGSSAKAGQHFSNIKRDADDAALSVKGLGEAFEETNGVMGDAVKQAVNKDWERLQENLQGDVDARTGVTDDVGAWLAGLWDNPEELRAKGIDPDAGMRLGFGDINLGNITGGGNENRTASAADHAADAAERAQKAFEAAGIGAEEFFSIVSSSSQGEFDEKIRDLAGQENSAEAISHLTEEFNRLQEAQKAALSVAPGSNQLNSALKVLGDEASTAGEKLTALKSAMDALSSGGLHGAAEVERQRLEIQRMQEELAQIEIASPERGRDLFDGNNNLNTAIPAATQLAAELEKVQSTYAALAVAEFEAGNIDAGTAAFERMRGAMEQIANSWGISVDEIQRITGILPETVNMLLNIDSSEAQQELAVIGTMIQNAELGKPVKLKVDTNEARQAIQEIVGPGGIKDLGNGVVEITVQDQEAKNKILDLLKLNPEIAAKLKVESDPATATQAGKDAAAAAQAAADQELIQIKGAFGGTMNLTPEGADNWKNQWKGFNGFVPDGQVIGPVAGPQQPAQAPPEVLKKEDVPDLEQKITVTTAGTGKTELEEITRQVDNIKANASSVTVTINSAGTSNAITAIDGVRQALRNVEEANRQATINITVTGSQAAIVAIDGVRQAIRNIITATGNFGTAWSEAMGAAVTAAQNMANQAVLALDGAVQRALESGRAFGANFASGINAQADLVRQAGLNLANAAAESQPGSPAKIGPLSGRGWTRLRGERMSADFAKGIQRGADACRQAALDVANGVTGALGAAQAGPLGFLFGGRQATGRAVEANVALTNDSAGRQMQNLTGAVQQNTNQVQQNTGAVRTNSNLVGENTATTQRGLSTGEGRGETLAEVAASFGLEMTSGQRDTDDYHGAGLAGDFQGTAEEMASFADWVTRNRPDALELIYSGGGGASGSIKDGAQVDPSFWGAETWAQHANHVHVALAEGMGTAMEVDEAAVAALTDVNASQRDVVNAIVRTGRQMDMSNEEIQSAIAVGLVESGLSNIQGGPDSSTGVFQQQNFGQWTANGRDRNNVMDAAASYYEALAATSGDINERMADVQRPREDLRGKYAERMAEAAALMGTASGDVADAAASTDATRRRAEEEELQGGGSGGSGGSGGGSGGGGGGEGGALDGIKKFIELFDHVQSSVNNAHKTLELMRRWPQNTKELNQMIDGVQQIFNDLQKFSEMAGGATGGAGGLSQINDAIDTAQEMWRVAGYFIGNVLGVLAGGPEGALSGNVRMLLDYNDNTLKTWSDNNPEDKRSRPLPGGQTQNNNNNGINQLNIYQGQGRSTDDILQETMYYVRASQVGAYAQ